MNKIQALLSMPQGQAACVLVMICAAMLAGLVTALAATYFKEEGDVLV